MRFSSKCKHPLPCYQGHYFCDTPVTMSCWHVLTIFKYKWFLGALNNKVSEMIPMFYLNAQELMMSLSVQECWRGWVHPLRLAAASWRCPPLGLATGPLPLRCQGLLPCPGLGGCYPQCTRHFTPLRHSSRTTTRRVGDFSHP